MGKESAAIHEELLVLRAQGREAAALAELVERWHGRLLAHALQLTRDREGAEEAMQEVWIAVVRGIGKLKEPGAFGFWVYRIVGRECANWVRRRKRVRREGNHDGLAEAESRHVSVAADGIEKAMDGLSVDHREVLALHYTAAMSVEEIAAMLDVKEGTIKSRLHYAREAMRRAMGEEMT
jgi:RNA polymerase sigma factor (sigma-70 family)